MMLHATAWREGILALAAAPLVYYALATVTALRFFRRERASILPAFTPAVSLLKPVRGIDFASRENFASFCQLDYPEYEILFAVNDEKDPAVPLIQQLIAQFPDRPIQLFVRAEHLGANRKVNKLARLAREARYDIFVLTDGDVRVGTNFLREVVAPLQDKNIGAVTSFYRAIAERNVYAHLEAVGAASDFFPGVLMAQWTEGVRFALGASIATTRDWLTKIGGFESLAGTLADDYELGNRIAKAGGKILLSCEPVWTMYPAQTFRTFWDHQVRWARTVRLCRPLSYIGLLFTQGLPWTLLAAFLAPANWVALTYLAAYVLLRFSVAWTVGVWGVRDEVLRRKLWLVPLRDAIHFVVWLASFASNRIHWGGLDYTIQQGRMIPLTGSDRPAG
ncbi:MAG TPA: bacteriohopanetetrol glucosamine biosynthesis glycosyltransferase HpnI [Methylomirabilota bacterium]|nr:bacteriohopanetetrol glucosamine biosynthesis glycosyltransferase HpnI [Methylomirabilota bacterium]